MRDELADVAVTTGRAAFEHAIRLSMLAQCYDDGHAQEYVDACEWVFMKGMRAVEKGVQGHPSLSEPGGDILVQLFAALPLCPTPNRTPEGLRMG